MGQNEEPFALKIILRFCFVIVFCIGLCGNLFVCIVVMQQRRMRTVMNCFTLNLAISDLIIIVIFLPSQYAAYENNQNWPFGNIGCRITYSTVPVCVSVSTGTLLAISCERFRGIVFPFQPRLRLTTVRRLIIVLWIVSITTALPLMIIAGTKPSPTGNNIFCDELWPNPDSSRHYWIAMFLLQYVIPLIVMSVLYGVAGWKLQQRSRFLAQNSRGRVGSINYTAEMARQRQSQKITKMLVALILIYSFCMLPQHVVYFWRMYGNLENSKYYLYVFRISNVFTMANSALNSIVYGTLQADFRKAYKLFFLKCKCCSCIEIQKENSSEERPYNKIAFRIKSGETRTLETQLGEKIKVQNALEPKNDGTLGSATNKTSLRARISSVSQSPLISGDSTSDSQHSKHSDTHKEHYEKQKVILQQNGVKLKELKSWNCENVNSSQRVHAETTYVKVLLNKQTQRNQNLVDDHSNQRHTTSSFEIDVNLDDLGLLDQAKETVL